MSRKKSKYHGVCAKCGKRKLRRNKRFCGWKCAGVGEKRTVMDIDKYFNPQEVYANFVEFPKPEGMSKKIYARYQALVSTVYATGLRISNVTEILREQFDFETEPHFVLIKDVRVNKRRKDHIILTFALPRDGVMQPFTDVIITHYKKLRGKKFMFPMGRNAAYKAIKKATGKWCHYFRSQNFSYTINLLKNTMAVCRLKGIKNPASLEPYFHSNYEEYKEELLK